MRAFVRAFPLLVVAAHLGACAANHSGDARATRNAAWQSTAGNFARERPDEALLARQPSPQCELAKPLEGIPPDQARAAMLDYEQQCYRQRADIVHARLAALQDAATKTRLDSAPRALLEPQPNPHCEPAPPAAGLNAAQAHEATLEAGRQCYKQLEVAERQKLGALQDAFTKPPKAAHHRVHQRSQSQRYMTY
jgi:hypothetical protein